ncbi:MAG: phosphatidate cytidylyltransferase [Cyanobacteria bacterium P01_D01_bin.73]
MDYPPPMAKPKRRTASTAKGEKRRSRWPWARIGSSAVAIPLALAIVLLGGWYFTAAFGIIVFLGLGEYLYLVRAKGFVPAAKTVTIGSLAIIISAAMDPAIADTIVPLVGTLVCFYLLFLPRMASIADLSASVMGLFYCGYLPSYWVRLRVGAGLITPNQAENLIPFNGYWPSNLDISTWPTGLTATMLTFACIWAADIGAYVMGKWLGRTRLSGISPKKTVEGSVFGLAGSVLVAIAGAGYLHWPLWFASGAIFGAMVGVASLLGDLIESLMKRDAGVKDSGQLIPGHGGVLDRTDSYIFTAPLAYYFVTLLLPLLQTMANNL